MATQTERIEAVETRLEEILGLVQSYGDLGGQALEAVKAARADVDDLEARTIPRLEGVENLEEALDARLSQIEQDAGAIARASLLAAAGGTPMMRPQGLYAKLVEVLAEVGRVEKRGHARIEKNGRVQYEYEFVTQDDLFEAIRPALAERDVAVLYSDEIIGRDGNLVTVRVRLTLVDAETGERETLVGEADGTDYGDKGASKAKTTALRYVLLKTFLVASDFEPEHENVEHERREVVVETKTEASTEERSSARATPSRPPSGDRKANLRERVGKLAEEADEVLEIDPGTTLGQIADAVQAEYGESLEALSADELVVVGSTVREFVDLARRAMVTSEDRLNYPAGKPTFDSLRSTAGTTWLDDWKGEGR